MEPVDATVSPVFLAWKKNAPYIYKTLITATLPWPSPTVQWLPDVTSGPDHQVSQNLLLGTRTVGQMPEYLRCARVTFSEQPFNLLENYNPELKTVGGYMPQRSADVKVFQRIDHSGEVNRARYMPQNQNLIATISSTGQAAVYDLTHFPNNPCGICKPDIELQAHTSEGFGLDWSTTHESFLITGANDGKVAAWDIRKYNSSTGKLDSITLYEHPTAVNSVVFHPHQSHMAVFAADDVVGLRDWRGEESLATFGSGGLAVACHPVNQNLVSVGTGTGEIELWDIRNSGAMIHKLTGHTDAVIALSWHPSRSAALLSGSQDTTAKIWDVSKLECFFSHNGHTAPVADVAWNPARELIASVADDNSLHLWSPAQNNQN